MQSLGARLPERACSARHRRALDLASRVPWRDGSCRALAPPRRVGSVSVYCMTAKEKLRARVDDLTAQEGRGSPRLHRLARRRDRRLTAWTEMAPGELLRELACASRSAPRAAHTLPAMLGDPDCDRRELFDLVARRLTQRCPVTFAEHIAAVAARRPMIDQLIHRPRGRSERPQPSCPGCPPGLRPERSLAAPDSRRGGSELGGREEFPELFWPAGARASRPTPRAAKTRRSIASSTSTTTSRPAA